MLFRIYATIYINFRKNSILKNTIDIVVDTFSFTTLQAWYLCINFKMHNYRYIYYRLYQNKYIYIYCYP